MKRIRQASFAVLIDAEMALLGAICALLVCPLLDKVGVHFGGDKAQIIFPTLFGGPLGVLVFRLVCRRAVHPQVMGVAAGVVFGSAAGAVTIIGLDTVGPPALLANPVLVAGAFRLGETLVRAAVRRCS